MKKLLLTACLFICSTASAELLDFDKVWENIYRNNHMEARKEIKNIDRLLVTANINIETNLNKFDISLYLSLIEIFIHLKEECYWDAMDKEKNISEVLHWNYGLTPKGCLKLK